jgi:hypothetical protein
MLKSIPLPLLVVLCLTLGLAPFSPEPHLWGKLRLLFSGNLTRPVDIFDLFMHGLPFVLLILRFTASVRKSTS